MTVQSVKLAEGQSDSLRSTLTSTTITLRYEIEDDDRSVTRFSSDVISEAIALDLFPAPGEPLRPGSDLTARNASLQRRAGACEFWDATVTFSNEAADEEERTTNSQQPPEEDTPQYTFGVQKIQRPSLIDYRGVDPNDATACESAAAKNAAGDQMDPVPELFYVQRSLSVSFNQPQSYNFNDYVGTTNQDQFTISGLIVRPLEAMLTDFRVSGPTWRWQGTPAVRVPYWRYTLEFDFWHIPKPCNVTILDPTRKEQVFSIGGDQDQRWEMLPLLRPDNNQPVDYIPYGDVTVNAGLSAWFGGKRAEDFDPTVWYDPGDLTIGSDNKWYMCLQRLQGVDPVTDDPSRVAWKEVPRGRYQKRKITIADIEPKMAIADGENKADQDGSDYITTPAYLDAKGGLLVDPDNPTTAIYTLYFRTAPLKRWTDLPWFDPA